MHSALYTGLLKHQRYEHRNHGFAYKVSMLYLDLDEVDEVFGTHPWWSTKRWRPVQFRRKDYLNSDQDLKAEVLDIVERDLNFRPTGAVRMLTNPRYFGFLINPITVYYCFDQQQNVAAIVAEVTNTPWGKRTAYALACDANKQKQQLQFDKTLHVSPFMGMDMNYHWYSNLPAQNLTVHIANKRAEQTLFTASLSLKRTAISRQSLVKNLVDYPWMTAQVALGIYWQALKLWLKAIPLHPYPKTMNATGNSHDH